MACFVFKTASRVTSIKAVWISIVRILQTDAPRNSATFHCHPQQNLPSLSFIWKIGLYPLFCKRKQLLSL
jgi:hypothetical protein